MGRKGYPDGEIRERDGAKPERLNLADRYLMSQGLTVLVLTNTITSTRNSTLKKLKRGGGANTDGCNAIVIQVKGNCIPTNTNKIFSSFTSSRSLECESYTL